MADNVFKNFKCDFDCQTKWPLLNDRLHMTCQDKQNKIETTLDLQILLKLIKKLSIYKCLQIQDNVNK